MVVDWLTERLCDPVRSCLIERLAGNKQMAQVAEIVLLQVHGILLLEYPNRRGRTEHHRDLVILHDLPPDTRIRPSRQAFVHHSSHAAQQRAIDDVRVSDHPADVGGSEVGFARTAAVDVFHARGERHRVATGVALHAFWFPGRTRGVEDV